MKKIRATITHLILSVPVRVKIVGIMIFPVLSLGLVLNYWVKTGLSDWLTYLLSDERVEIALSAGSRSVLLVTILAALASTLLTFLLMFLLTRPLLELRLVASQVAAGNLKSRAEIQARDEIGDVAESVNLMIDQLVATQERLQESNQRLESMNQVAMAAGKALDLDQVIEATLKGMLNALGLAQGWVFLRNQDSGRFYLAGQQNTLDFLEATDHVLDAGQLCACQKDLLSGELGQVAIIRECRRFEVQAPNGEAGYHLSIPLVARGHQLGIVNLVHSGEEDPSPADLDLLTAIGAQASEIVVNAWLHSRLVEKEAARQTLLQALVRAQEDERARLSRELHDGAGQTLTSLLLRLKALENQAQAPGLAARLEDLCEVVSETIDQVHDLSYRLRPVVLEEFGLEVALRTLLQEIAEETNLEMECQFSLEGIDVPAEIETALYRIAQESLTNVVRHAQANRVLVELTKLPYAICMRVEDDGRGFEPSQFALTNGDKRIGLLSLAERAEMIGGSMTVYSAPGSGTSIQIRIPLYEEERV